MASLKNSQKVLAIMPAETLNAELKGKSEKEIAEILLKELSLDVKDQTPEQRENKILRRNLICNALGISTKTTDQFLGDLKKYVIEEPNSASPDYPTLINNIKNDKVKEGVDKVLDVASEFIPPVKIIKLVYSGLKIIINGTKNSQNPTTEDIAKSEAVKIFMEKVAILNSELDNEIAILSENKKTMNKSEFSKFKKERLSELRKKMEQQYNVKMSVEDQENTQKENTQSEPGA